jgi:hypothetical protein
VHLVGFTIRIMVFCVTEICRKTMCIKTTVTCNEPLTKPVKFLDDIPVTERYSRHS